MDKNKKPLASRSTEETLLHSSDSEATRVVTPNKKSSEKESHTARAPTQARQPPQSGEHARAAAETVVGHNRSSSQASSQTELSSDATEVSAQQTQRHKSATEIADDRTRAAPGRGNQAAKPTVVNGDLVLPEGTQNSVFAHLEHRIRTEFAHNRVLKQRFVLEKTLGAGGMGNVYLARDLLREEMEDSSPFVAIKVLNDECRRLPGALQSLQREAKKAQTLSHPNIVTVYDFDRDGETAFITMEYIDGDSLKDYLRKKTRIPHRQAMDIIERVARGLAYAHQQGFVHADIKPANIFLGSNGVVKILDFGIAKAFTDAAKEEKRSLADDLTEGALTPSYASLEMLRGHQALPSDDVYALSVMAYEIIHGRHPFLSDQGLPVPADAAIAANMKVEPIQGIPRRHMRALKRGLQFERSKRFRNAGEFIDAIKSRNWKKDGILLASAAVITGAIIFVVNQGLEQVVPSVDSLKPELVQVRDAIVEGDELLAAGDIDFAHRLYSQAWEVANDLTVNDVEEREKAQAILQDRRKKVSEFLIDVSQQDNLDEYRLRELYVALEFLLKDELGGNEKRINKALKQIERRIEKAAQEK